MSEVFELVIKYYSLTSFIFGMLILYGSVNNVSSKQIIYILIIGGMLIHSSYILYLNRKNKTIQKYIGAASIINII